MNRDCHLPLDGNAPEFDHKQVTLEKGFVGAESPLQLPSSGVAPSHAGRASEVFALRLAFSIRETAEILGVSEKTVRRLIQRKLLRSSLALRHKLIPKKEIERFLDETTR